MKKLSNQEIADNVFKKNKEANKVFVCGGYPFLTVNAANLHRTTSGKKELKVVECLRKEAPSNTDNKKKTLSQLNLTELKALAKEREVLFEEGVTKKELKELLKSKKQAPKTSTEKTDNKPVELSKMSQSDLLKVATLKGVRPEETATKEQLIEMIEAVDNSEIKE